MSKKPGYVLMKEQSRMTADPMCVSESINTLLDCAETENLAVNMLPLREVGNFVPVDEGKAVLHIEETIILP